MRAKRCRQRPRHLLEPRGEVVAVAARQRRLAPAHMGERAEAVPLHLEQPAGPLRRLLRKRREHRPVLAPLRWRLGAVVLADQQPVLRIAAQLRGDERPEPFETLAVEVNREPAVALLLDELVRAVVPDLDRAGPVLAGRDPALEGGVVERMILDVHREHALPGLERDSLRHGPAQEHAVALEAEVVVEATARRAAGRRIAAPFPCRRRRTAPAWPADRACGGTRSASGLQAGANAVNFWFTTVIQSRGKPCG